MANVKREKPLARVTSIWDKDSISKYPETVVLMMSNGHPVKYRIDVVKPHPSFLAALENIRWTPGSYQYRGPKEIKKRRLL